MAPKQLSLFDIPATEGRAEIPLHEFFEAYFECRRNKRGTANATIFETDYERHLVELHRRVNDGSYSVGRAVAFVVHRPVQREIFAADFSDRVVHHLLIRKLNPLFERAFIYDSYACRVGRGTLLGIKRADRFIRQCSKNYSQDSYVLKLDIEGFFIHINRKLLYDKLLPFVNLNYKEADKLVLLGLIRKIVFNEPTKGCIIKGGISSWEGLPLTKTLFHARAGCGLPIGNLTSQIFANFYMNEFDHWIKNKMGIRYYGRYVDDFLCIHHDKEFLKLLIPKIAHYLQSHLGLTLHPKKIYLQHYTKGVKYLGAVIMPYRLYASNRTVGNFHTSIMQQNAVLEQGGTPTEAQKQHFINSMNSYLGFMKHYKSYKCRQRVVTKLSAHWWHHVAIKGGGAKFILSEWWGEEE